MYQFKYLINFSILGSQHLMLILLIIVIFPLMDQS